MRLAKGHGIGDATEIASFERRWTEQPVGRYNWQSLQSVGGSRRRGGSALWLLKPKILERLCARLKEPPDDRGVWTSAKAAAFLAQSFARRRSAFGAAGRR